MFLPSTLSSSLSLSENKCKDDYWLHQLHISTQPSSNGHYGVSYTPNEPLQFANPLRIHETISLNLDSDTQTHHVAVGGENSLSFNPDQLNANIGDRVTFNFYSLIHTLTQSSLEAPCVSLRRFDTGFGQFNSDDRDGLSLTLTVNTLEPQWYYCRQNDRISHCHAGMVFALNPGNQMDQLRQNAK